MQRQVVRDELARACSHLSTACSCEQERRDESSSLAPVAAAAAAAFASLRIHCWSAAAVQSRARQYTRSCSAWPNTYWLWLLVRAVAGGSRSAPAPPRRCCRRRHAPRHSLRRCRRRRRRRRQLRRRARRRGRPKGRCLRSRCRVPTRLPTRVRRARCARLVWTHFLNSPSRSLVGRRARCARRQRGERRACLINNDLTNERQLPRYLREASMPWRRERACSSVAYRKGP